ncbi:MAG TPA: NnrS family protein [Rubrivivax sp.]|nr:NnrS family protein [Burkholderiales bacterium]HNT38090.1 NnrS family protein [Rubrivivax sp.]
MNQPLPSSTPLSQDAQGAPSAPALQNWPLLRLGFRPFYLGTALLACLSVPVWVGVFLGHMALPLGYPALLWHGHEMLFGFAAGVVMGFLLTAVRAWTGMDTARGALLGALALLWLAARVAAVAAPYGVFAVLDLLLLPAVAIVLLRVLLRAGNKRNVPLVGLLLLMALANAAFHLSVMGAIELPAMSALYAQLALVLMVVSVMTGRVLPMFTRNGIPGLVLEPPSRRFELWLLGVTGAAFALWVLAAPASLVGAASLVAAVMHARRLWCWKPWATLRRPILWVLHLSYVWMPLGFLLLALAQWGWVAPSLAVHAFAVGVIGGLVIGMITRTARGHTGRPLKASGGEAIAYGAVLVAALVRVLVPALHPEWTVMALGVAAALWGLAFLIYLAIYTPWLTRTRLDGKDG